MYTYIIIHKQYILGIALNSINYFSQAKFGKVYVFYNVIANHIVQPIQLILGSNTWNELD